MTKPAYRTISYNVYPANYDRLKHRHVKVKSRKDAFKIMRKLGIGSECDMCITISNKRRTTFISCFATFILEK